MGPPWDPLHEQILCCCGRANCVVVHGHRHPQRRQRLLGRQRRKLGRGHRSRGFRWLRRRIWIREWRRSWSLGRSSSPRQRVCFCSSSGRCLFCAASPTSDGGLCPGSGSCCLCARAGRLRPRSRGDLCACACGVCAGSGGLRSGSCVLCSPVRLPRPLVSAAQWLLCAPSLGGPDRPQCSVKSIRASGDNENAAHWGGVVLKIL